MFLPGANALAYLASLSAMEKKSFITLTPGGADRLSRTYSVSPETLRVGVPDQPPRPVFQTISGYPGAKGLQLQRQRQQREQRRGPLLALLPHVGAPERDAQRVAPHRQQQPPPPAQTRLTRASVDETLPDPADGEVELTSDLDGPAQQQQQHLGVLLLRSPGVHPAGPHQQQWTQTLTRHA